MSDSFAPELYNTFKTLKRIYYYQNEITIIVDFFK